MIIWDWMRGVRARLASIRERDGICRKIRRPGWRPQETGKINVRKSFLVGVLITEAIIWLLRRDVYVYVLSNICIDRLFRIKNVSIWVDVVFKVIHLNCNGQSAILCRDGFMHTTPTST
jgi:hypothetical protein